MRDYRDAKAMARSLRDALIAKALPATHSESLELVARAFGYDNWNILAAKIDAAQPRVAVQDVAQQDNHLHCSFCGKSQLEVRKLVAGPAVNICDKCVSQCSDVVDEQLDGLIKGDEGIVSAMSTERLLHYVDHAGSGAQRSRSALERIERVLALRENTGATGHEELQLPEFAQLNNKTRDQLKAMQQALHDQLRRYEHALRTATSAMRERTQ